MAESIADEAAARIRTLEGEVARLRESEGRLAAVLEELADTVFGRQIGDEPNVYADYDKLCEYSRRARAALAGRGEGGT